MCPKRGFFSPFRKTYQIVNLATLEKLAAGGKLHDGAVTPEVLRKLGVVKTGRLPVKILGTGELKAKLDVAAHAFSKSAAAEDRNGRRESSNDQRTLQRLMAKLGESFRNIFKIQELRTRLLFTAALLIVVRIGAHITLPGCRRIPAGKS